MSSFLNLKQNENEAVAAVPDCEIVAPDGTTVQSNPSAMPSSPTTSTGPSHSKKEHRQLFLPMPTMTTNNTTNSWWSTIFGTSTPTGIRAIAVFAFAFIAVLLCSVTVRHLTASTPSNSASNQSSLSPLPTQQPIHQMPSPPLADQLDALRSSMAQLQNAIAELQQQQKLEPATEAQIWAPPNYAAQRTMSLARRQMTWQPMKRMIQWQPVKRNLANGEGGNQIDLREQVILAVEEQLVDVLKAGKALGISAEEILTHLRARNGEGSQFFG